MLAHDDLAFPFYVSKGIAGVAATAVNTKVTTMLVFGGVTPRTSSRNILWAISAVAAIAA
jgi:hypothetical protein